MGLAATSFSLFKFVVPLNKRPRPVEGDPGLTARARPRSPQPITVTAQRGHGGEGARRGPFPLRVARLCVVPAAAAYAEPHLRGFLARLASKASDAGRPSTGTQPVSWP